MYSASPLPLLRCRTSLVVLVLRGRVLLLLFISRLLSSSCCSSFSSTPPPVFPLSWHMQLYKNYSPIYNNFLFTCMARQRDWNRHNISTKFCFKLTVIKKRLSYRYQILKKKTWKKAAVLFFMIMKKIYIFTETEQFFEDFRWTQSKTSTTWKKRVSYFDIDTAIEWPKSIIPLRPYIRFLSIQIKRSLWGDYSIEWNHGHCHDFI